MEMRSGMENVKYQLRIPKCYKEHGGKRLQATEAGRKTMEWEGTEEKRQARSENVCVITGNYNSGRFHNFKWYLVLKGGMVR